MSNSNFKVIGQSSRSQEEHVAKVVGASSSGDFSSVNNNNDNNNKFVQIFVPRLVQLLVS